MDHPEYRRVYVEPDLPYDMRQQQRNSRLLLNAVGKKEEYKYVKGRIVRRSKHQEQRNDGGS